MIVFAWAGRVSTEDRQDPEASRAWQLSRAQTLIAGHGEILFEFFDIGHSRSIPWPRRPESSRLLAALRDPRRPFDAVVIGEPQRAFYGNQFGFTFPLFEHYGVPLWVPEVGGAIDPVNEAHDMIMLMFGGMSKAERNRIKIRVRAAMAAQAALEGRFLGGRPPYGYRLADAGPHPNPAKAADGKRLHVLERDPVTAPIVERIFQEYVDGAGFKTIAERLTADGIPSPSAADRARNPHRSGIAWSQSAIRVIIQNPRYTGRQVWGKQRKDEVLLDIEDIAMGHITKMRWTDRASWIYSAEITHAPLVDDETFQKAQDILAGRSVARGSSAGVRRRRHSYQLRGRMRHNTCGRLMQGSWNNGKPHYRCGFLAEYAVANTVDHPRSVYVREELIIPRLDRWVADAVAALHLPYAIDDLFAGQDDGAAREYAAARDQARKEIAACDRKLLRHRAALEAGADAKTVTDWIAETKAERAAAERRMQPALRPGQLAREEIAELVGAFADVADVLSDADPDDKAELYRQLGLTLTYDHGYQRVAVAMNPFGDHVVGVRVRGGTQPGLHDPFHALIDLRGAA